MDKSLHDLHKTLEIEIVLYLRSCGRCPSTEVLTVVIQFNNSYDFRADRQLNKDKIAFMAWAQAADVLMS